MPSLRLVLAQLNLTVGDVVGNQRRIASAIRRAQAWLADIVVVPELALTGYPPEDLLLKPQFVQANLKALKAVAAHARGLIALVGCVARHRTGGLTNAMAVLAGGRHVATYAKQCLPNYGVFDEKRYFIPGDRSAVLQVGSVRLGLSICEDLWMEQPTRAAARLGAQVIVNISASPYHAGKLRDRERLFASRARQHHVAVAYCNLIGGQDELVFDGGSLVLDARGRLVAQAAQFAEDLLLVDLAPAQLGPVRRGGRPTLRIAQPAPAIGSGGPGSLPVRPALPRLRREPMAPVEEVYEALLLGLRDYVRKNGFSTVVLGISGGVDSALTACLAADALGPAHVMGVVMPSRYSSPSTQEDAKHVGRSLGIEVQEISIEPVFQAYLDTLKPFFGDRPADVAEQNIQARIRGNLLMALSNKFGWLVLTTGNKSEIATGYTTLYGDMAGGFAVIKDVPKTLVYQLARYRNQRGPGVPIPSTILQRAPSAELAPNQRDQDTLPSYDVLDRILKAYVEEDRSIQQILQLNQVGQATVRRVAQMVDRAEYKRRQGPPGIKITPKAFGRDRRMPITNRFQQS
jgi:NAD+ synthase (glutamine-hydrolysing)